MGNLSVLIIFLKIISNLLISISTYILSINILSICSYDFLIPKLSGYKGHISIILSALKGCSAWVYLTGKLCFVDVVPAVRLVILRQRSALVLAQLFHWPTFHEHAVQGNRLLLENLIYFSF